MKKKYRLLLDGISHIQRNVSILLPEAERKTDEHFVAEQD